MNTGNLVSVQADAWSHLWMRTTLTVPNDKGFRYVLIDFQNS